MTEPPMRKPPVRLLPLLLALLAVPLAAQPPNPQVTVLRAAQLIDGTGAAPIRPAMIRIEGERIVEVGASVRIGPGDRVIDLGDATLLPGLIRGLPPRAGSRSADWLAPADAQCDQRRRIWARASR